VKEKIKKIGLTFLYLFIWVIFLFSLLGVFMGLSDIEDIKKGGIFLMFLLLPFLSGYFLRNHFKFLFSTIKFESKANVTTYGADQQSGSAFKPFVCATVFKKGYSVWKKNILYKMIIIAIPIAIVGGIWWYQYQQDVVMCKRRCVYNEYKKVWQYKELIRSERSFPTQEQCIDYCLID